MSVYVVTLAVFFLAIFCGIFIWLMLKASKDDSQNKPVSKDSKNTIDERSVNKNNSQHFTSNNGTRNIQNFEKQNDLQVNSNHNTNIPKEKENTVKKQNKGLLSEEEQLKLVNKLAEERRLMEEKRQTNKKLLEEKRLELNTKLDSTKKSYEEKPSTDSKKTDAGKNLDLSNKTDYSSEKSVLAKSLDVSENLDTKKTLDTSNVLNPSKSLNVSSNLDLPKSIDTSNNSNSIQPLNIPENLDTSKTSDTSNFLDSTKPLNTPENLDIEKTPSISENLDSSKPIDTSDNITPVKALDISENLNPEKTPNVSENSDVKSLNSKPKEIEPKKTDVNTLSKDNEEKIFDKRQQVKTKILIVDDARFMRIIIRNILKEAGYDIVGEAETGRDAIRLAKELTPDIITMDITMPDISGITAVEEIMKHQPKMKIIMLSADDQAETVVDALKAGALNFISKPFEKDNVLEIITKVLKGYSYNTN